MTTSDTVTHGIRVEVESRFVPERSNPATREWFFAYQIKITNQGFQTVQLISRHWIVTDGDGRTEEVRGAGVVGEQPVLRPGDEYEYTSACPLRTSFGTMHGTYRMKPTDGEEFDVEIAPFALGEPYSIN